MPEEFDPAWEYHEPDPEIAELFAASAAGASVMDRLVVGRDFDHRANHALRFGRGNPDYFKGRFARAKPDRREQRAKPKPKRQPKPAVYRRRCPACRDFFTAPADRKFCSPLCLARGPWRAAPGAPRVIPDRECAGCRRTFRPDRDSRKHCSDACYKRPGAARTRPRMWLCFVCMDPFAPNRDGSYYCSRKCGSRAYAARRRNPIDDGLLIMTLDDAKRLVSNGAEFGDVYVRVPEADRDALKHWFANTPGVPNLPGRARMESVARSNPPVTDTVADVPPVPTAKPAPPDIIGTARASGYTGNICPACNGCRMTRSGACEKCMDCGAAGGCG